MTKANAVFAALQTALSGDEAKISADEQTLSNEPETVLNRLAADITASENPAPASVTTEPAPEQTPSA